MAREERFRENHENFQEYFPVLNKVQKRKPKFSKSSATLVSTLTVAASVALVTALFLVCRVLSIEPTSIRFEVSTQGGSAPVQYAVIRSELLSSIEEGCLPDLSEADKTGTLRGGTEIITADGLIPSTQYTVLFWTADENGLEVVQRYNYKSGTPAGNVYIEPPAQDAPSAAPPVSAAPSVTPAPTPTPSPTPSPTPTPSPSRTPRPIPTPVLVEEPNYQPEYAPPKPDSIPVPSEVPPDEGEEESPTETHPTENPGDGEF